MKKTTAYILITIALASPVGLYAQGNEIDAYTLSNTGLGGTARSMSMGGAFGALGGDISVISSNPAGLGIYRSSEVSGTIDFSQIQSNTQWNGLSTDRKTSASSLNNFGMELYFPSFSEGINSWNFGFSYNRIKNYTRKYKMSNNGLNYSIADYIASRASNAYGEGNAIALNDFKDNPYNNPKLGGHWLPVLGIESGIFDNITGRNGSYQSSFGFWNDDKTVWTIESPDRMSLIVNESGHIDEYNFGLGTNIDDIFFLGASVSITDIDYRYSSMYEEYFTYKDKFYEDNLYLENSLTTEGTGYSCNLGAIVNLECVRLGIAYNTPRYYDMTDYYGAQAGTYINGYNEPKMNSQTPDNTYSEYSFKTPGKWIFSGAAIFGKILLFSADYEISDYSNMLFSDRDGVSDGYNMNNDIKSDYTVEHTLKIGAEGKITPQFAIRAGYMLQTTPMRKDLINNNVEVLPSGTIPHYTTTANTTFYYTAGIGYRFTPNFYMDLACIIRNDRLQAQAFSNIHFKVEPVETVAASLKTNTVRLALTLGYKF